MTGTARRRVLIVHSTIAPAGGAEAVAAWMIQALQDTNDVAVVAWGAPDFDAVNRWYGTSIRESDVRVYSVSAALRKLVGLVPARLALVHTALVLRTARRLAASCDVAISTDNEIDLGRRLIQYVHYPRFLRPRPDSDLRWIHRTPLLPLYYCVCDRLIGGNRDRIAHNRTLVNSAWTAERVRALYPAAAVTVVPPPVACDPDTSLPWSARENGFVCIGRFAAEKELDRIVAILSAVRRVVPDVNLHIAGSRQTAAEYRALRRLARRHRAWIQLHENLSRAELQRLIARQRYGIHAMREEHFGIAPAEMVRAGCIVFVSDTGGPVDIVGSERRLLFGGVDEAVSKIVAVLTSPGDQITLRAHLAGRAREYSAERFMSTIRDIVGQFDPHAPEGVSS